MAKNVRQFITNKPATIMGHLHQSKQGIRLTKTKPFAQGDVHIDIPEQEVNNEKTHHVYIAMEDIEGKIYSNQTGKFPQTSSRGMK